MVSGYSQKFIWIFDDVEQKNPIVKKDQVENEKVYLKEFTQKWEQHWKKVACKA